MDQKSRKICLDDISVKQAAKRLVVIQVAEISANPLFMIFGRQERIKHCIIYLISYYSRTD